MKKINKQAQINIPRQNNKVEKQNKTQIIQINKQNEGEIPRQIDAA